MTTSQHRPDPEAGVEADRPSGKVKTKSKTGPEKTHDKLEEVRGKFLVRFGQVTLSLMGVPRYGHQSISDLQRLVLEPLIRDRIAVAPAKGMEEANAQQGALAGIAIWASVSDEVDQKIREQIKAGVFPVRLTGKEWASGDKVWLLDVIAPSQKLATSVLANFNQVVKGGQISLHPIVSKMIDPDDLKKMGAQSETADMAAPVEDEKTETSAAVH